MFVGCSLMSRLWLQQTVNSVIHSSPRSRKIRQSESQPGIDLHLVIGAEAGPIGGQNAVLFHGPTAGASPVAVDVLVPLSCVLVAAELRRDIGLHGATPGERKGEWHLDLY
jgi:hypothetical protein